MSSGVYLLRIGLNLENDSKEEMAVTKPKRPAARKAQVERENTPGHVAEGAR